jgi:hypothetical protein
MSEQGDRHDAPAGPPRAVGAGPVREDRDPAIRAQRRDRRRRHAWAMAGA